MHAGLQHVLSSIALHSRMPVATRCVPCHTLRSAPGCALRVVPNCMLATVLVVSHVLAQLSKWCSFLIKKKKRVSTTVKI